MNGRKILFGVHGSTYFTALLPLITSVKEEGYIPIVIFSFEYPTVIRDQFTLKQLNIDYYDSKELPKYQRDYDYKFCPLVFFIESIQAIKRIKMYEEIIKKEYISLVVLAGDLLGYDTSFLIKAAHNQGVKIILHPSFMADATESAEFIYMDSSFDQRKLSNHLTAQIFPKWGYRYKNKDLVRLPSGKIWSRQILGISPPKPWTLHSGFSDDILVESKYMFKRCVMEGLPPEKIHNTGSIAHDRMYQTLQEKDKKVRILLTALPPDMITTRPQCDFETYIELIDFWMTKIVEVAKETEHTVRVSLHPSINQDRIKWIETKYGVTITQDPTYLEIAKCTLFVASVSSVIQWAIACGLPVINYDIYRYAYPDYLEAKGVITFESKNEFKQHLLDPPEVKPGNVEYGILDGNAHTRIMERINHHALGLSI